jgi:hypothetical protein
MRGPGFGPCSLLHEVQVGLAAEVEARLFGPCERRGFPFDRAVDDAAHLVEEPFGAGARDLAAAIAARAGTRGADGLRESEAELRRELSPAVGVGVINSVERIYRSCCFVFHTVDLVFCFFYGSIVA